MQSLDWWLRFLFNDPWQGQNAMGQWLSILHEHGLPAALAAAEDSIDIRWPILLLAILTPLLIIYCRNESRVRRLKMIQDFIEAYPSTEAPDYRSDYEGAQDPSLEFVKSKYMADVRLSRAMSEEFQSAGPTEQIQIIIRATRGLGNPGDFQLFASSLGFIVISYFGFSTLFDVLEDGLVTKTASTPGACPPEIMTLQFQVIGSLAFAGAFVAAVRMFMRGLAAFDLSAYTFLKQTIEMLASILLIIVAFKAFPDPLRAIGDTILASNGEGACSEIPWYWLALAPVLALLPESSSNFMLTRMQSVIRWVKRDDDRFADVTRVIPLNVIEGIDYFTRFRLEQCGIHEVQNLATYNPIMLFVESPYGIYQCVDWVGQAQLCHIVGIDRFLMLREIHVRTVFDLERAIDFRGRRQADDPPEDGPEEFDLIFAAILLATTEVMRNIEKMGKLKPFYRKDGSIIAGSVEDYCAWAHDYVTQNPARAKICIEHLMGWISDDLHVRRLRRIWQEMSDSIGLRSERLDNPRRPARDPCPSSDDLPQNDSDAGDQPSTVSA